MKAVKYLFATLIALCLASCGGDAVIKPTSSKVNGALSEYFEVVDREYKLSDGKLNVEFKRISEGGPADASWNADPTFTVELLDDAGNSISTCSTSVVSDQEQLEAVFALGVDETSSITFEFDDTKGAVNFKVTSKWNENAGSSSLSGDNDTLAIGDTAVAEVEDNSNSTDWDSVLDEYESFVDKYIKLYKKAQTGDMSAVTEYAECLEKAESLQSKLDNAKSDLTAAQAARLTKIAAKMQKAVM